ncbi:YndJ family protein [Ureibacillus acetophenoni]|uniref:YndJ-like protein n=1 Tax=Ureibacillus acetophenoni TaxID=614649 RepID=A0A285ULH8_9BACL|nr:YndJ family protein [Ureibacillus acetophenoni]SOC42672.1 YndJ-like protein [Ureibacillus acetophenoni]
MIWNKWTFISIILFLIAVIFGQDPPYLLLLTVAQVVYVPLMLQLILKKDSWFSRYYAVFTIPAFISVVILHITDQSEWDVLFAAIYLLFTCVVAAYGISRFLTRGFVHFEEFSIDAAFISLSIGGMWYFAYITNIDTGFSPMITWLTAIHFHYAAFLLPVFVGLLGRIYKPRFYPFAAGILLISLFLLAIGITFSVWIEWVSVVFYIIGIYMIIYYTLQAPLVSLFQRWLIVLSFSSLGVTILLSFLYALGRLTNDFSVSIDFMLQFHGMLNCVIFALLGVIGWSIYVPPARSIKWTFPVSKIRGSIIIAEKILSKIKDERAINSHRGLVDEMAFYRPDIEIESLAPAIRDFYENTFDYRLYANVQWKTWFKPFAAVYRLISSVVQQINLPLSSKRVEMTGDIITVNADLDGRSNPRAWVRKINNQVTFIALYSSHRTKNRTYMNIALPLPWTSMIGILELRQVGDELQLSSKKRNGESDAGIYLAWSKQLLALPIEETFHVKEMDKGRLYAEHHMWIFSIPFLKITYRIEHRDLQQKDDSLN